jgi:tRNA (guanine-N7-)-methyltransferase
VTARRRSVFADRLLEFPDLVFSDGAERCLRGHWRDHFRRRIGAAFDDALILDIGCANGELLLKVAAKRPRTAFIGLDWKCRSLYHAAQRLAEAGVPNVALLHGRAQEIDAIVARRELDEIWLFHPEPCDTDKTLPHRLFDDTFLLEAHRALPHGGRLMLKTDHAGYFQWALALFGEPEPPLFVEVRQGLKATARVRRSELVDPAKLPAPSDVLIKRFQPTVMSLDYWNDPLARAATAVHAFADETSGYEARFKTKRWPIYYMELCKCRRTGSGSLG